MDKPTHKSGYRGIKTLSYSLDIITKPVFVKRGFAQSRIITHWHNIVGDSAASCSIPRKLTFQTDQKSGGTLYLEVNSSSFAAEIIYLEPMILEKIAGYFGYRAISRLKILQNPQTQNITPPKKTKTREILPENKNAMEAALSDIDDEELKNSLRSLGLEVLGVEVKTN